MTLNSTQNGKDMTIALEGRLDTTTAPELEKAVGQLPEEVTALTLDFAELAYISSAGLRVVLAALKKMKAKKGNLVVRNMNETIREVFDVTGFLDIITVE